MYSYKNIKNKENLLQNCCWRHTAMVSTPIRLTNCSWTTVLCEVLEKESLNGEQLWTRLSSALTKDLAPISLSQAVVDTPSSAARIHLTPGLAYLLTYSTYTCSYLYLFWLHSNLPTLLTPFLTSDPT